MIIYTYGSITLFKICQFLRLWPYKWKRCWYVEVHNQVLKITLEQVWSFFLWIRGWCSCSTYVRQVEKAVRREPVHYSIIYLSALWKMYSQVPPQKRQIWLRTCFDTDVVVTQANLATYNEGEHWHTWLEWKTLESRETPSCFWEVRGQKPTKTNTVFIDCILLTFEENFPCGSCIL